MCICIYIHSRAYTHIVLLSIFQASYMIYKVYYSKTVKKMKFYVKEQPLEKWLYYEKKKDQKTQKL